MSRVLSVKPSFRLFPCMDTYFHQKFDIENNEKNNSDSDVDDSVGDSE